MTEEYIKTLGENFSTLRENIEKYKKNENVRIVAATKNVDVETINYAAEHFELTDIGENRVQELLSKYESYDKSRLTLHFIGNLQKNKVKYIVGKVALIHSLDSVELAKEIEKQSAKINTVTEVLVEVNIADEENKSGADVSEIDAIIEYVKTLPHVKLRGMMTIGPKCYSHEEYREYFDKTYKLFCEKFSDGLDNSDKKGHNVDGGENYILSMGMSDSYTAALEAGANAIRPGQCLFNARKYSEK